MKLIFLALALGCGLSAQAATQAVDPAAATKPADYTELLKAIDQKVDHNTIFCDAIVAPQNSLLQVGCDGTVVWTNTKSNGLSELQVAVKNLMLKGLRVVSCGHENATHQMTEGISCFLARQ